MRTRRRPLALRGWRLGRRRVHAAEQESGQQNHGENEQKSERCTPVHDMHLSMNCGMGRELKRWIRLGFASTANLAGYAMRGGDEGEASSEENNRFVWSQYRRSGRRMSSA